MQVRLYLTGEAWVVKSLEDQTELLQQGCGLLYRLQLYFWA